MKPKPVPKKELVIGYVFDNANGGGYIRLRAVTEDAKIWLRTECPQFGELIERDIFRGDTGPNAEWSLDVRIEYNANEVAEYLESYNDED